MKKLIFYLENILLGIICIFLIFAPYGKHLIKIYFCGSVFFWLLINILKYKQKFYRGFITHSPLNKPLLLFLAAAIISTVFSLNPYHSQSIFFERYLPYAILFWVGTSLVVNSNKNGFGPYEISLKNLYFLIGALIFSGIIFGIGGAWDYFHCPSGRLFSVFGKMIPFSMFPLYLIYYIPLSFALLLFSKKWLRFGGLLSLVLLIPCWIWQGSRVAWIAISLSLLTIAFIKNKKLALILLLVFIISFFLLPKQQLERAKTIVTPDARIERVELFKSAGRIFEDFPVFGAGVGMYEKLLDKYKYETLRVDHLHSHNTYLEIVSEMGLVGLSAFLWLFVVFFKNVFKTIRSTAGEQRAILLGLTGTIITALIFALGCSIITVGTQGAPMFWLLLGMASALLSTNSPPESLILSLSRHNVLPFKSAL